MKTIAVILLVGVTYVMCISEEMQELANMLHNQCRDETGCPEELILNARKGDFADDQKLKCYIRCLYDQMAVMEDDGTIDEEGLIAVLPEEHHDVASVVIHKCGTKVGADPCDNAWLTNKCYYSEKPDMYYLP